MKTQTGYSMPELMIVVLIISILAAIAIPNLKSYLVRAKVTNLILAAEPAKLAVSELLINGRTDAEITNDTAVIKENINSEMVNSLKIAGHLITVTSNPKGLGLGKTENALQLKFQAIEDGDSILWRCGLPQEQLDKYKAYVPDNCRQAIESTGK